MLTSFYIPHQNLKRLNWDVILLSGWKKSLKHPVRYSHAFYFSTYKAPDTDFSALLF
jgi:hypothetical protein